MLRDSSRHVLAVPDPLPPRLPPPLIAVQRENKLLRAGFEGRKQGFIATPKRAA